MAGVALVVALPVCGPVGAATALGGGVASTVGSVFGVVDELMEEED